MPWGSGRLEGPDLTGEQGGLFGGTGTQRRQNKVNQERYAKETISLILFMHVFCAQP